MRRRCSRVLSGLLLEPLSSAVQLCCGLPRAGYAIIFPQTCGPNSLLERCNQCAANFAGFRAVCQIPLPAPVRALADAASRAYEAVEAARHKMALPGDDQHRHLWQTFLQSDAGHAD